ncbi:MAG: carboxypeptidase-like regulatory domain-containing protein, partial [Acidobacteria bacterium]|nr:carboxypeptidase-like regulatory domain-containing protein [Acidobacteriota bacterium]
MFRTCSGLARCGAALLVLLSLFTAVERQLSAQVATASVTGTVKDATGASISGAAIVLERVGTGVQRKSTSNDAGVYAFLDLVPGTYTVQVSQQGFGNAKVEPFALAVNQTATFDVSLQVGAIEQSVSVRASGVEVQASTAELGAVIQGQKIV